MSIEKNITTLQYLILIHEMSYTKFCKEIGVTPQQFTDWVKKRRPIPKERLEIITQYFNVDEAQLVEESHYILDLTEQRKLDFQIGFLKQKLADTSLDEEKLELTEKLDYLTSEQKRVNVVNRFEKLYKYGSVETKHLCDVFLNKLEAGQDQGLMKKLIEEK